MQHRCRIPGFSQGHLNTDGSHSPSRGWADWGAPTSPQDTTVGDCTCLHGLNASLQSDCNNARPTVSKAGLKRHQAEATTEGRQGSGAEADV